MFYYYFVLIDDMLLRENDVNDIMISYDFQAGSYVEAFTNDLKLKM